MKKILIISFTDLDRDPRVNRQIRFLKDKYKVTAVGTNDPQIQGVHFIGCGRTVRTKKEKMRDILKLISRDFEGYYWSANHINVCLKKLKNFDTDIVIANDIDSLPLALRVANGSKVVFDAHEYAPKEFEDILRWRILYQPYKEYLCSKYIKKAEAMMTVCQGIADEYAKTYGVNPVVITNAPQYQDIKLGKVDKNNIRIIFHGAAHSSRKLENMIKIMEYLDDRFKLDFMLTGDKNYINSLKKMASQNKRINFLNSIPMNEICRFISQYDVGLYLLEPNSFNNKMALPNKFFEFIQARLAVAIGPSQEMAKIVQEYDCGVVAADFTPLALAKAINALDEDKIQYYKAQSDKLAAIMCAEKNKELLLDLIENL